MIPSCREEGLPLYAPFPFFKWGGGGEKEWLTIFYPSGRLGEGLRMENLFGKGRPHRGSEQVRENRSRRNISELLYFRFEGIVAVQNNLT